MLYLLAGFLVFWIGLYALKAFAQANPAALAQLLRRAGGWAALVVAGFLLLRGRVDMAIGLGGLAAWLLRISYGSRFGLFRSVGGAGARRASCVRSAMIEMELDHATGKMRGVILAGPDEGKQLDALTRPQCELLHRLCCRDDPDGARLLEAYLDRRFPGWRPAEDQWRDEGSAGAPRRAGAMSKDEAYEVLGLQKGASREEVVRSHRSLMKKLHPDHGGTTDLAARVNEAKDVLMRRHQ
ncbi:DnaJ domain-containing protein [Methylocapsa acidiphila]|uniref:DnaJ domain-containing protein n=1 Tax=Methylocapsa acidiphila TaxID=133552 RepID=UPI000413D5C4|nr:DnaJ domain-containing protein [Methylocapsa acidiphila]